MHRHDGDRHRDRRNFSDEETEDEWRPSERGRKRARHHRHRPYNRSSRANRLDWFTEADGDID